ncbi:MAG TPA: NAD(P)H-binding protein [Streptosporangiaceae bacterium]|jgi:uncharacterized protein YbjT (DUF2867 family)
MILVTGANGNVGRELVLALLAAGRPVRALTKSGDGSAFPPGAEVVAGDLNDPASLRPALAGATGLFLLPGYADMPGVLAKARQAGATRVVQLSGMSAGSGDMSNAVTRYMAESEQAAQASGLDWTILRPAAFMSNTLQWLPQLRSGDVVRAPFAHARAAMTDPADIAAVAALSLTMTGHEGRTYAVSGPEPLTPADRVRILGEVLGRELRFEGQSNAEARAEMSAAMPAKYVDAFFDFYVAGTLDESKVLPTVPELTGRPARTFAQWAAAHTASFN